MKTGELQRTMSLLWFSLGHVILTLHTQTKWRFVSSLVTRARRGASYKRRLISVFFSCAAKCTIIQDHEEHCDALFWITEDRRCVGLIDFLLGRSKHIQRKA